MRIINNKEGTQVPYYVLADISARSEAAYMRHKDFFENPDHIAAIELIEEVAKEHIVDCSALYVNARAATSKTPVHTEVKLNHVQFKKEGMDAVDRAMQALGIDSQDIVYNPRSPSFTIKVK